MQLTCTMTSQRINTLPGPSVNPEATDPKKAFGVPLASLSQTGKKYCHVLHKVFNDIKRLI